MAIVAVSVTTYATLMAIVSASVTVVAASACTTGASLVICEALVALVATWEGMSEEFVEAVIE